MSSPKLAKTVETGLRGTILGIGNPLLDISARVDPKLLQKYDLQANNAILAEAKHQPLYAELMASPGVELIAGGATQNSIRTAQWMLGAEGATAFVGAVGKGDEYAKSLKRVAAADGVRPLYFESTANPTGVCGVLITGHDRSLVTTLAACNDFKCDHVEHPEVAQAIASAKLFYSAGFFLTGPEAPQTLKHVGEIAARDDKIFCTNLSAPFVVQFFQDQLMGIWPFVDFLFCNEAEGAEMAKKLGWATDDLKKVALDLTTFGKKANGKRVRTVVITQGRDPTIVANEGKVSVHPVKPVDQSKVVDTNGAGDAFVGGFIAALVKGAPLDKCVEAGHYSASVIVQRSGCTFPPHRPELVL